MKKCRRPYSQWIVAAVFSMIVSAGSGMAYGEEATSERVKATETLEARNERMAWWREARFGMFIHWGLYNVAAGEWEGTPAPALGCWMLSHLAIPPDQYGKKLMPGFTAANYNPTEWAKLAKRAGMKYAVMTSKHHEGFCLFDSQYTDFDVMNTPAKKDLVKLYLDAFHDQGLKAGLYYSVIDWHHPQYPVDDDHPLRVTDPATRQPRSVEKYVDYMHHQVEEIATNYTDLDIMWWDFSYGKMSGETWRAKELVEMVRKYHPSIIMNNRLYTGVTNHSGDFATPEQYIPPTGLDFDWESCMTINGSWGYHAKDYNYKSSGHLIQTLVDTVSKGGNFLLNVGPRPDGTIPEPLVERLEAMGQWMDVYSDSIYGTQASPFTKKLSWGRCSSRRLPDGNTRLYLHVFDWPADGMIDLPLLKNEVVQAYLLTDDSRSKLPSKRDGYDLDVLLELPSKPSDLPVDVVVVDIQGTPEFAELVATPDKQGRIALVGSDAILHGETISYPCGRAGEESIGSWMNTNDWVSWNFHTDKQAKYRVVVTGGVKDGHHGTLELNLNNQTMTVKTSSTGGWFERKPFSVGTIDLPADTKLSLEVRTLDKVGDAAIDLQKVELIPLETDTAQ